MSFESERLKMQKMWESTKENQNLLNKAQSIQAPYVNDLGSLLPNQFEISALNQLGGDYQDIAVLMTTPYQVSGFQWTITKTLPEVWIPNLRIDVGYNWQGGDSAFDNMPCYFNKVLNLTPSTTGIVTATWNIGLFFISYDPTVVIPSFQAKLYFTLIDPSTTQ
jgi:hypothetical protein